MNKDFPKNTFGQYNIGDASQRSQIFQRLGTGDHHSPINRSFQRSNVTQMLPLPVIGSREEFEAICPPHHYYDEVPNNTESVHPIVSYLPFPRTTTTKHHRKGRPIPLMDFEINRLPSNLKKNFTVLLRREKDEPRRFAIQPSKKIDILHRIQRYQPSKRKLIESVQNGKSLQVEKNFSAVRPVVQASNPSEPIDGIIVEISNLRENCGFDDVGELIRQFGSGVITGYTPSQKRVRVGLPTMAAAQKFEKFVCNNQLYGTKLKSKIND